MTKPINNMSVTSEVAESAKSCTAAIFGVTGLVGKELAKRLLSTSKWEVYGIARRAEMNSSSIQQHPNYHFISCDLLNPLETQQKLASLADVTHIFWVTWASQYPLDSKECSDQNRDMMWNVLNAIVPRAKALKHVSLQTGSGHYVSLSSSSDVVRKVCYYNEESPRVDTGHNFYYVLEDLLKERLASKVAWSIHRPGLLMGCSQRTLFNFIGSLCVYGTICKYLRLSFVFGGTREWWEEMCLDASDARLVAEQHIWAAEDEALHDSSDGQAYNAVNGDSYTWKALWPGICVEFGLDVPENMFSVDFTFSAAMSDKGEAWKQIVVKEGLVETEMQDLANWDFLDVMFRCPFKMLSSRDKVDRLGFSSRCQTLDSIIHWIKVMREDKLIPWN